MGDVLGVAWGEYKDWRKQLSYGKHHTKICYICHVPQISDDLHPTFAKATKGGRAPWVVSMQTLSHRLHSPSTTIEG